MRLFFLFFFFVRPTVEVGKAGWSGLGCYIQVVEIGPHGEKKGL